MTNPYDIAHELAQALKESEAFKKYRDTRLEVLKNEEHTKMLEDYQTKVMELQLDRMKTGKFDEAKLEELKNLEGILMANSVLGEYLKAEMTFSQIFTDINKIISDAVEVHP